MYTQQNIPVDIFVLPTSNDLRFPSHIFLPFLGTQLGRGWDDYTAYTTWQRK